MPECGNSWQQWICLAVCCQLAPARGFVLRFRVAVQLTAGTFGGTAMVREAVHVWN